MDTPVTLQAVAKRIEQQFDALPDWKKGGITFDAPIKKSINFKVGQKVSYKGKFCIIEYFPVSDMVVVRNLNYTPGDWHTAKTFIKELKLTTRVCNCPSPIIFVKGCQCGGV